MSNHAKGRQAVRKGRRSAENPSAGEEEKATGTRFSKALRAIVYHPIASGLITSLLAFLVGLALQLLNARFAQEHEYLIGRYYGYYFLRDGSTLVQLEVSIRPKFFRKLAISTRELNAAAYEYEGSLNLLSDVAYSQLTGTRSDDLLYFVLRVPFNHTLDLPALNGVFVGLTQAKEPASTKVIISRTPMDDKAVREDMGNLPWYTFVDEWPSSIDQLKASPDSQL
jgi:hypothetical protein